MEVAIEDRTRFIESMKDELTLNPKTTALVAVDMHQGHLDPEIGPMLVTEDDRMRVLTNAGTLIGIARQYRIPIIHVILQLRPVEVKNPFNPFIAVATKVNERLKPQERGWQGKAGSPEGWWRPKIMSEVAPQPDDYVIDNKKTYSIYLGTDLENLLKTLKIDAVAIIGINTNTCDLCAAFETANRGYKVIMISDCVASAYGNDLHLFALQNVARSLGWVLTIREFEGKLRQGLSPGDAHREA